MLNIDVNRSAEGVERYFDRELAVSDYLMKEPGVQAGRGAERLGLRGPVQRSQFVALLRNENPTTGKRLTARMNTSRQEDGDRVSSTPAHARGGAITHAFRLQDPLPFRLDFFSPLLVLSLLES
jgi:hypothetical protein